jgi:cystatin-C
MRRILFPCFVVAAMALSGCRSTSDLGGDVPGGYSQAPAGSRDIRAAAEFAVAEQSKSSPSGGMKLVEIVVAEQQVVSGMNYRLVLRVKEGAKVRDAVAMVWWQSWNTEQPYRLTSWNWR